MSGLQVLVESAVYNECGMMLRVYPLATWGMKLIAKDRIAKPLAVWRESAGERESKSESERETASKI